MNWLTILGQSAGIFGRFIDRNALGQLQADLARIEVDDNVMAQDFHKLLTIGVQFLQQAEKVDADYIKVNADIGPIANLLGQLKGK